MNFRKNNIKNLVARYLQQASERLESARALLKIENFGDSISRSYYAILDAASACLINKDVVPQSHSGAMKFFSLHYIKSGIVDKKYQRQFAKIEKARVEADYTHLRTFTGEEAKEILSEAEEFVAMANNLLLTTKLPSQKTPQPF